MRNEKNLPSPTAEMIRYLSGFQQTPFDVMVKKFGSQNLGHNLVQRAVHTVSGDCLSEMQRLYNEGKLDQDTYGGFLTMTALAAAAVTTVDFDKIIAWARERSAPFEGIDFESVTIEDIIGPES